MLSWGFFGRDAPTKGDPLMLTLAGTGATAMAIDTSQWAPPLQLSFPFATTSAPMHGTLHHQPALFDFSSAPPDRPALQALPLRASIYASPSSTVTNTVEPQQQPSVPFTSLAQQLALITTNPYNFSLTMTGSQPLFFQLSEPTLANPAFAPLLPAIHPAVIPNIARNPQFVFPSQKSLSLFQPVPMKNESAANADSSADAPVLASLTTDQCKNDSKLIDPIVPIPIVPFPPALSASSSSASLASLVQSTTINSHGHSRSSSTGSSKRQFSQSSLVVELQPRALPSPSSSVLTLASESQSLVEQESLSPSQLESQSSRKRPRSVTTSARLRAGDDTGTARKKKPPSRSVMHLREFVCRFICEKSHLLINKDLAAISELLRLEYEAECARRNKAEVTSSRMPVVYHRPLKMCRSFIQRMARSMGFCITRHYGLIHDSLKSVMKIRKRGTATFRKKKASLVDPSIQIEWIRQIVHNQGTGADSPASEEDSRLPDPPSGHQAVCC